MHATSAQTSCKVLLLLTLAPLATVAAQQGPRAPFEKPGAFTPAGPIDKFILADLQRRGMAPANLCSDEVFLRRVYLDLLGAIPEGPEVRRWLQDKRPNKRVLLVNDLLARDEFARYWSLRWGDVLRVKAEFPINLWPNAVQAYDRWIYEAIRDNMPADQFARELLTSSGSNFRVAQVNFYRALQGQEPASIANAVALTFMGTRLDSWSPQDRANIEAFFSRIAFKGTAEWKEEIVLLDPAATEPLQATLPDGRTVTIAPGQDPRAVFADWLLEPENPWFARSVVNRTWFWLMGRGIIHEPDDIRPDNPPVNPELLAWLEKELVRVKYDTRHLLRLIINSRTYQQSSIPNSDDPEAASAFACYGVRQLDAEVLVDALCQITGTTEKYESPIPEPFTFVPEDQRSIELSDGSITSGFLEMFGRPARDTGLLAERNREPTDAQRLHLLNSTHLQRKITNGPRLQGLIRAARGNRQQIVDMLYVNILSRPATAQEAQTARKYFDTKGVNFNQAACDVAWALINSKEFLFQH